MSESSPYQKGVRVFCRYNPGRYGHLTGRNQTKAGAIYHQVSFSDNNQYVPEYELEIAGEERPDPFEMIKQRRFGLVSDLRRNLSHLQLSGRLASVIYSMDATNTDFYPHQFKPVLAFLDSPSRGLLIADEVGLGKTIEAGLIWTELRARYDSRRVLVVCPAMLREKWRDELRDRFGIDATIMNARELLTELRRPLSQITDGKGIICSIQGIRSPSGRRKKTNQPSAHDSLAQFLDEQSSNPQIIDLLIIDEAHYLRNRNTQNWKLGILLRDISENVILLSATPINLHSEDLYSLLNIVDPDTFNDLNFFPKVLSANEHLIKARDLILDMDQSAESIRCCLAEAANCGFLRDSEQLQHLIQQLDRSDSIDSRSDRVQIADRIERVNLLGHIVNRTRKKDVTEWKAVREPKYWPVKLEQDGDERKFYDDVSAAIIRYARERNISDGFLLANPQRQVSSCMYAAAKSWRDRSYEAKEQIYEDMGIEVDIVDDISPLIDHLISEVLPKVDLSKLRVHDSKFEKFYSNIKKYFTENPQDKIVVFSYFRATLHYLQERLDEHGICSQVLMGGMKESKQDTIHRFRESHSSKVLLSSEVASEGVDLQFCHLVVNYDLPWNPMKIEQRIGRLDRIGQKSDKIIIWNFGYEDTIDDRIYKKLLDRLGIFEHALGGMDSMLGEAIKKLTDVLVRHKLTPEQQEEQISQTATAIENNRQQEDRLEKNASNFMAHGEYLLNRIKTAHDLKKRITDDDLVAYVQDYLNRHAAGREFHQPDGDKLCFYIKLPPTTAAKLGEFVRDKKLQGYTRLATGDRVQCEFVNKTGRTTGRVEQIGQFHPLVRFINSQVSGDELFPVIAARLQHQNQHIGLSLLTGQYVFAVDKWAFSGLRNEEDMRVRVVRIESDHALDAEDSWRLLNAARLDGEDWPGARTEASPLMEDKVLECYDELEREFQSVRKGKDTENSDRVNFQIKSAEQNRDRRLNSLERVLDDYRSRNEMKMIPATKGRIKNIKDRCNVQIANLGNKAKMHSETRQVCCGILLLD